MKTLRAGWLLAAAASTLLTCSGVRAEEKISRPFEQVRARPELLAQIDELLQQQDAAAAGIESAADRQKQLLVAIGRELAAMPEDQLQLLAIPAVAYVLSGGDPRGAERFIKLDIIDQRIRKLLDASAKFMGGHPEAAQKILAQIDPRDLPSRVGGRVALAQALLSKDIRRQEYFALALSAMPGTLIEESALRRSALAYAEAQDERMFWLRTYRYARRFPLSSYAAVFWGDAMAAIASWQSTGSGPNLDRLDTVVALLPVAQRRLIYLALARRAAMAGLPELSAFAGRRLRRLAAQGSDEDRLGLLYSNLFEIVGSDGDAALLNLKSVRLSSPDAQDRALLSASLAVGAQIERPAPPSATSDSMKDDEKTVQETRGAELLSASYKLMAEMD